MSNHITLNLGKYDRIGLYVDGLFVGSFWNVILQERTLYVGGSVGTLKNIFVRVGGDAPFILNTRDHYTLTITEDGEHELNIYS